MTERGESEHTVSVRYKEIDDVSRSLVYRKAAEKNGWDIVGVGGGDRG